MAHRGWPYPNMTGVCDSSSRLSREMLQFEEWHPAGRPAKEKPRWEVVERGKVTENRGDLWAAVLLAHFGQFFASPDDCMVAIRYIAYAAGGPHVEVFIFIGKGGFCGATKEPSGINLPRVSGPWRFFKKTNLTKEKGINLMAALREIKAKGYYLIRSDSLSDTFGNL
jgi:hypothetical protein